MGMHFTKTKIHSTAYVQYSDFLDRAQYLMQRLLKHDNLAPRMKSALQKLYGHHHEQIERHVMSISQMAMDRFPFT
jgi:hypothetical protein